jgi:hypothetical protein
MLSVTGVALDEALGGETSGATMRAYVDDLADAGILLAAEAIHSDSSGACVRFAGRSHAIERRRVGPKARAVHWILIEVRSLDEAIIWASRCPTAIDAGTGWTATVEINEVQALSSGG